VAKGNSCTILIAGGYRGSGGGSRGGPRGGEAFKLSALALAALKSSVRDFLLGGREHSIPLL
jgi:hypothetical protein